MKEFLKKAAIEIILYISVLILAIITMIFSVVAGIYLGIEYSTIFMN
jgi:hypothetical protein